MKARIIALLVCCMFVLVACGEASQEDVVEKVSEKWNKAGYDLQASMEVKTGGEPRLYDVTVWHTKPDFYRVTVKEQGEDVTQMIVRNEEGVFVVTPALRKTYKFQSEWPKQNSQAYLIGGLAEDLLADETATMTEQEGKYVFDVATRNREKTAMPMQQITIDKKTMLPTRVSIMNEALEEQVVIEFKSIDLSAKHKADEYAVEKFDENEEKETAAADIESEEFRTHYPVLNWDHTKLVGEKEITENGMDRVILTFEGEKPFTLMQQPIVYNETVLPVFSPGDPADLGFTIGAMTDNSISWEKEGVSFFIASNKLTREEMIEVAASVTEGSMK